MSRKKGKSVSFDAMVKFFMQQYNILTKKDLDILIARLDGLEALIQLTLASSDNKHIARKRVSSEKRTITSTDVVLDIIKRVRKNGVSFTEIKLKTGFEEKKLRNIIFRLSKRGKIIHISRGVYMAS